MEKDDFFYQYVMENGVLNYEKLIKQYLMYLCCLGDRNSEYYLSKVYVDKVISDFSNYMLLIDDGEMIENNFIEEYFLNEYNSLEKGNSKDIDESGKVFLVTVRYFIEVHKNGDINSQRKLLYKLFENSYRINKVFKELSISKRKTM